jgi:hypothetical protein
VTVKLSCQIELQDADKEEEPARQRATTGAQQGAMRASDRVKGVEGARGMNEREGWECSL